uniref:ARID domain-containing protein n=1 Tax=Solanum lycopersicum TaxID=4081 RepID=K4DEM3_SOLLC
MVVDRSDDPQIKTNATIITADDDARSDQFLKVTIEVNDSFAFIGEDNEVSHEDQTAFIEKLGTFYREKAVEFKLPRFYGHPLNCLKLWKFVIKLGGYDQDLHYCSWTFHGFYEKLLLQYERHTTKIGVLQLPISPSPIDNEGSGYPISASGRAVRDSAARCRLGWQQKHLLGYGEVAESIVGCQVVDVGPPADWMKINVYATVPGLLREEVRIQSNPSGRLVIIGQPNQLDNFWGVTTFKKMVISPARINQLRTSADVSLHGCLHVHVPFAQQNI